MLDSEIYYLLVPAQKRNFSFGKLIGAKVSQREINNYIETTTIEGLYTLNSIYKLINHKKVEMPIIDLIYDIIYNNTPVDKLLSFLIEK